MSGTIGSQDWLKMALLARLAGIEPRKLRFVALEGGGEEFTAMQANYVQVISGDTSEATLYAGRGKVRVLAVLAEHRLPGVLARRADRARAGLRRGVADDPRRVDGAGRAGCRLPALGRRLRAHGGRARLRPAARARPGCIRKRETLHNLISLLLTNKTIRRTQQAVPNKFFNN
jgi:hypothetical protein